MVSVVFCSNAFFPSEGSGQEQEVLSFPVYESHSGSREDEGAISSLGGVTAAVSSKGSEE